MNYYEQIIINLKALMDHDLWEEAAALVDREQQQPYLPPAFAVALKRYAKVIKQHELPRKKFKYFFNQDFNVVLEQIKKGVTITEGLLLLQTGSRCNLRDYLKLIQTLLMSPNVASPLKTNLFMLLIDQDINKPLKYLHQGDTYHILTPVNFKVFGEEPCVQTILTLLENWIANENVALYDLCLKLCRMIYDQIFPNLELFQQASVAAGAILINAAAMQGLNKNPRQIAAFDNLELQLITKTTVIFKQIIHEYDEFVVE